MINRHAKIVALLASQEQERAWMFEEANVLDHLEKTTGYDFGSVGSYMLFGARSLSLGDSMGFKKNPTIEDLRKIASKLKPVPMIRISSGCCSFQPEETVEPQKYEKVLRVAPFTVTLESSVNQPHTIVSVNWYTKVLGNLYRVNIYITDKDHCFGKVYWRRYEYEGGWGIKDTHCSWGIGSISRNSKVIANCCAMTWARGSETSIPNYTMYWTRFGSYVATPVDMVNNMLEVINA